MQEQVDECDIGELRSLDLSTPPGILDNREGRISSVLCHNFLSIKTLSTSASRRDLEKEQQERQVEQGEAGKGTSFRQSVLASNSMDSSC